MNIKNLKYSKCPHCKKYGIGAWRGVGRKSNHTLTCKYCKKRYRMNWALSFVVKISLGAFYGILAAAISTYVNQIPAKVIVAFVIVVALISYYLIIRICPMEEVDDE